MLEDPSDFTTQLGDVTFIPSVNPVLYYEIRVYAQGTVTPVVATKLVSGQKADPWTGLVRVHCKTMLNALSAGNYDVTVAAIGSGGTSESSISNAFTVPLS